MSRLIIGIDPGLSGAVAFYYPDAAGLVVEDMPVFRISRGGKEKGELNAAGLARMIESSADGNDAKAVVEQVGAMPGQGVSSVFSFGKTFGQILGVLAALGIETNTVSPVAWKRASGIKSGAGKDISRKKASDSFPRHAGLFSRVKDDGRAEAALIALYAHKNL